MAIQWGAWEYSGGNGMRVGIDVDWETITHAETAATVTLRIYTENQFTYGDGQTLSYGGSISGSTGFTNNQGGAATLRATKTFTYTYGANSYGTSPGNRTFSASLSGAYNGVTPSKSVTTAIPGRPTAAPAAPSSVAVSRITDASTKLTWNNNETAGEPYSTLTIQRQIGAGAWATVSVPAGSVATYTAATAANVKYRFQIRADNGAGSSSFVASAYIYTSPAAPTGQVRTDVAGPLERITWSNASMGYTEYSSDIIGYKNGVSVGVLGTVATGVATFDHTTSNPVSVYTTTDKWKYTVRHKTSTGTLLYSAETPFTTETAGVSSIPNAPTALAPNGGTIDPTVIKALTWTHNPTDSSAQTQFQIRHRVVGAGSWTTESVVTSGASTWNLPANTYTIGQQFEWQVTTRGSHATFSAWSTSATLTAYITKIVPASFNVGLGVEEVDLTGFDWKAPTLGASWVDYGAPWEVAGYCRRGGLVHLRGLIKNGTATSGTLLFTLPAGYRPVSDKHFRVHTSGGGASMTVQSNGDVKLNAGVSDTNLSLAGMIFPAEL